MYALVSDHESWLWTLCRDTMKTSSLPNCRDFSLGNYVIHCVSCQRIQNPLAKGKYPQPATTNQQPTTWSIANLAKVSFFLWIMQPSKRSRRTRVSFLVALMGLHSFKSIKATQPLKPDSVWLKHSCTIFPWGPFSVNWETFSVEVIEPDPGNPRLTRNFEIQEKRRQVWRPLPK